MCKSYFYMAVLHSMCVYFFCVCTFVGPGQHCLPCVCVLSTWQHCIPSSIVQLDVSINFCIAGFHQLQLMVIEGTMQWSCSRYFLSLIFLHFPWLVSCVWQFQFCRLMLSNSIIASHCCGSVAVFHNSLAPERRSSVKDEIQPRSCESYYRTTDGCKRQVIFMNYCLMSKHPFFFCQCLALVLHSFNSSPSQFSEIVFLKEH